MTEFLTAASVLTVADLKASRKFYVKKLGFRVTLETDGWCFLSRDAIHINLRESGDAPPVSAGRDHSWFGYFTVRGIEELYERCQKKDVEIWHPLAEKPWGMREFAIVTVDQHRIVFGEESGVASDDDD